MERYVPRAVAKQATRTSNDQPPTKSTCWRRRRDPPYLDNACLSTTNWVVTGAHEILEQKGFITRLATVPPSSYTLEGKEEYALARKEKKQVKASLVYLYFAPDIRLRRKI